MWVLGFINDEYCGIASRARLPFQQLPMAGLAKRFRLQVTVCLHVFLTCRCNVRPGAAADPACVSGWMKRSCPPRAGELLRPLDSSPLQPTPPGEHAACLNKERRGKAQRREKDGKIELK